MRTRVLSLVVGLVILAAANVVCAERPNFVLIFIDDLGYGDIGPFGSEGNPTPHLDQMAREGLRLTSFYAAPVCSASRAQLLTGCYAPRVSVPGVFFPAGRNGLNPEEITIAEYLKDLGYATACVGKWHLGDQPQFLPTNQGFDRYFGIPYSNDMQRIAAEDGRRVTPLLRNAKVERLLEDEQQREITRDYTKEALDFIEAHAGDTPFFLYLAHTAVHVPIFPHPDFAGKSKNGAYGDWVAEVDWSVGQVLDALRRKGIAEDTLVIFTSDNGPWTSRGKAGGVSGPLRGSKGCTLEGGVREPTIAWWPGRIEEGGVSNAIAGTTDILPTIVRLAGGKTRPERKIDGVDISPLLLGNAAKSPRTVWHYYSGTRLQAIRSGPWKLALTAQTLGMGIKEKPEDLKKPLRLYNLEQEIGERTDVAEEHPDIVANLQALANAMIDDIGSGASGPGVRPPGAVQNPVTLYPTAGRKRSNPGPRKPVDWSQLKLGDTIPGAAAPLVTNRPFTLHVSCSELDGNGVLAAHGGAAVGYSLYVLDGKLVFAVRHSQDKITRVALQLPSESRFTASASLTSEGVMQLQIEDGPATSSQHLGLLNRQPQEDFCLGSDNGNPVDSNAPRERPKLADLQVKVQVGKKSN